MATTDDKRLEIHVFGAAKVEYCSSIAVWSMGGGRLLFGVFERQFEEPDT